MNKFPGSSKFFLEGCNEYSREALQRFIGDKHVEKFCALETVQKCAHQALINGQRLLFDSIKQDYRRLGEVNMKDVVGIAISGSLSSNY
jgi:hypothetical protein